jgi:undecaprenyl-diphosphatase
LPSDHAALFFALSAGLWYVSHKIGLFFLIYTIFCICLPRIYLGYHYPSDLLAGAVIGIVVMKISNIMMVDSKQVKNIMNWQNVKPEYFYPVFFLVTYQICDLFNSVIAIVSCINTLARHFL